MFKLNGIEFENLNSQIATSSWFEEEKQQKSEQKNRTKIGFKTQQKSRIVLMKKKSQARDEN